MPFTPVHLGPGAAMKLAGSGRFSFTMFEYGQICIDLETLLPISRGDAELHGFCHTWLGALAVGALACVSGKPLCQAGLRLWNRLFVSRSVQVPTRMTWTVAAISAFLGTFSHVLLDGFMYADVRPWRPFSESNSLFAMLTIAQLHWLCLGLGGLGAVGLLVVRLWQR